MKRIFTYLFCFIAFVESVLAVNVQEGNYNAFADTILSLPQVSVTAVKLGSQLRSKPVSATIVGQQTINRDRIVNMHQVSDLSPNLYIPRYGSRITSSIYMRGIGARIDQPAVGLTIDNIPILNKDSYDLDIDDIARVDILRGPQSSMFGRSSMMGMININTLSPLQFDGVRLNAEYGSYNSYRASVSAYHEHNDSVGVALGGNVSGTSGYYRNSYNSCRVGGERVWGLWYKWELRPVRGLSIENVGRFSHSKQSGYPYESVESGLISYNDTCFYKRNSFIDGLTVSYNSDRWSFTSITSVQHIDDNMTLDQDFLPLNYFTLTQKRKETSVTQDFILNHRGEKYSWLAGFFGFSRCSSMIAPVTFGKVGISKLIEEKRNEVNRFYPIKWHEDQFVLNSDFRHPTRGLGFYHNSNLSLGNWSLSAAIRLDIEEPKLDFHSFTSTGYTIWNMTDPESPQFFKDVFVELDESGVLSHTYVEILPKVTALYNLDGGVGNVYASVAKGYKPGGYNTQMFSDFLQQKLMATMGLSELYDADQIIGYRPERSWNYEVGAHLDFLDGDLSVDLAAFYVDCHDQQLTRFPNGTTTGRIMDNAGRTRSIGGELALRYNISNHWLANFSWGYADARFVDYNDGMSDFSGKHVPYAPLNTMFGQLIYETTFNGFVDRLQAVVGVRGTGTIYWNESNSSKQRFYAPVNLSLNLYSGIFSVKFWAENVNAVKYSTFYFKSMGNEFIQRGAPFICGMSLTMQLDFGLQ